MTWEELKEKAKEMMFYKKITRDTIIVDGVFLFDVEGGFGIDNGDGTYKIVSQHRTPDQMLMIMRGLE